ncbi:uncharacterized protein LOC135155565 [Lytechinus pictus]|uniref:uncharacterized protein LOC135155565 n=1 Tax=Lytechinus pictus TaxID=7653 RepID=UPI0030B9CC08
MNQPVRMTELPVECPDINGTVATNHIGLNKYSFNVTIGPENVTKSIPQYRYHGGDVSVALGVRASPIGSVDDLGTYQLTIADDVLRKTCEGPIRILGRITVATVVIIVMAAIAVIVLISFISYRVVKAIKRSKTN